MKKRIGILLLITFLLTACNHDYVPKEEPHLYWRDINVTVTDIERRHWFATTHWYSVNITVKSEEYSLEKTFEIKGSGAFGCPKEYNYNIGDIITAELYSWKIDSTDEIVRRDINSLK